MEKKSKGKDKGKVVKVLTPIKPTVDDDSDDGYPKIDIPN